jgi:hypothetical protein
MRNNGSDQLLPFKERLACSINEAEVASGISRSSLYKEMDAGRLEFFKRGTRRLIRVPSLLRLINAD